MKKSKYTFKSYLFRYAKAFSNRGKIVLTTPYIDAGTTAITYTSAKTFTYKQ